MPKSILVRLLVLPLVVSCATPDNPTGPVDAKLATPRSSAFSPKTADSLALAVALALRSEKIRMNLLEDLRDSPFQDHSIHLRSYLNGPRGREFMASIAKNSGRTVDELRAFEAGLPQLTLQLDRTFDRATWKGTSDIVVYAPIVEGHKKLLVEPTARGFATDGTAVTVPTLEAGPGPYLAIKPTQINFGRDPEGQRSAAPKHTDRLTVSTPEYESGRKKSGAASFTIIPPPPCDPNCAGGGGHSFDGISMPNPYTAAYCLGWTSWGAPPITSTNDTDHDGIKQECEYQLAYQFRPQMARNSSEDAPDREPYWSVTRIPGTTSGIKIFYALSYYRDAGEHVAGFTSHDGDTEFVIVELENNMNETNPRLWQLTSITLSAHWNSPEDNTAKYTWDDLEYPATYRGRPRVWESWDKHANYRTKDVCNSSTWDVCTTGYTSTVYDNLDVISSANLGNEYDRSPPYTSDNILVNCVYSRTPAFNMPGYECFWVSQGRDTLGWHAANGQAGATPYYNMFYFYGF